MVTDPGDEPAELRAAMVSALMKRGALSKPRVAAIMKSVPRHIFVPGVEVSEAYADRAIPTHYRDGFPTSSVSQPAIVASMLEQLDPPRGGSVLEIGAGTGYNAALLSHLVGPSGRVVTVDIDPDVARVARAHLGAAGMANAEVICGDGAAGYAQAAPYDGIIVTAGVTDLAPAWVAQLAPAGRLVVPLSIRGASQCVAFTPTDRILRSVAVCECGFMPLQGTMASTDRRLPVADRPGVFAVVPSGIDLDPGLISEALARPGLPVPLQIRAARLEAMGSLRRWIAFQDANTFTLSYAGPPDGAESSGVPAVVEFCVRGVVQRSTGGIFGPTGFAIFDISIGTPPPGPDLQAVVELSVRPHGDSDTEREELHQLIQDWDAAGRPGLDRLQIEAHPVGTNKPPSNGYAHDATHTRFIVTLG